MLHARFCPVSYRTYFLLEVLLALHAAHRVPRISTGAGWRQCRQPTRKGTTEVGSLQSRQEQEARYKKLLLVIASGNKRI